ncbi:MAG: elongation factor 4 [Nitrospirae bacterium CG_4_9_14_3_um_filter_53_35]|nr:MAG: elongation factor 4 [Nitrospirae bacterium CG2_30_53_67]PIS36695.1 MAG: elongation factor 4 [Nitrospirae bacterium CG08_land_8_20_14_0_20_52_24]PIV82344.1 MAG: elongation factor 4 [Nitrospirae bacterium CG17_big_fil_post_rev_8_21_14_2_50_50_9]PIW85949.1 MAG: elongation factor 4 [Nitrospirae bacterium CG_4_8_14_3_um_filter_50_41]PJA73109.1 MAG: elongation factor 4 [Nitrospirae bacterium CG_4_9_14_3_um_filter_53_35]
MTARERIRNFSIIAHIDHGKSTLADRILDLTGALTDREKMSQFLDQMDIERERGITIKAQTVRLRYLAQDRKEYCLNLIDTPGHVDFNYEVSRSLAACEGALLVVDAAQGVEAQTVGNVYLAIDHNLEIIPVINKIDLPNADVEKTRKEIEDVIGLDTSHALSVSAKLGTGVRDVLESIVRLVPPPKGDPDAPLKALLFDSWFDPYMGTVSLIRVIDGVIRKGMRIRLMFTDKDYEVQQVGVFTPHPTVMEGLSVGEVGFFMAGIKNVQDTRIGDTVTESGNPTRNALPGFKHVKPMVFAGLYPVDSNHYKELQDAMEKLSLNDSSFSYDKETSNALGFGFRCGFLGLLHMEIIQERLEREFSIPLISTSPTVVYKVLIQSGEELMIENPSKLPPVQKIEKIFEPLILATIMLPAEYMGSVITLAQERRGVQKKIDYHGTSRVTIQYELPLNEIVVDFYDRLKSTSRGYASMDYEFAGYREAAMVRLDILINGEIVDALSLIVHKDRAYHKGRKLAEKLKKIIHRQMFEVVIQASVGNKVIARESISALRKNVTAKCYGGDITRKRKLLEKQKEGKKRMKSVGSVEIPQEAFMSVLSMDDEE